MAEGCPGIPCFVTGTVLGRNGEPVAGAALDPCQAGQNFDFTVNLAFGSFAI